MISFKLGREYDDVKKVMGSDFVSKVMERTILKTTPKVRTKLSKNTRDIYNIKVRRIQQASKILYRSIGMNHSSVIHFMSRRIGLVNFVTGKPQNVKVNTQVFGNKRKRFFVRVKKTDSRRFVRGGFVAAGKHGNVQLFQRKGDERNPIASKQTISVSEMVQNPVVMGRTASFIGTEFRDQFENALGMALTRKIR